MLLQMEGQARSSRQALSGRCHAGRVHGADSSRGHGGQQWPHARSHVRERASHVELTRVQKKRVRAPQVIEELLSRQARGKSKIMQMTVAHVAAVRLNAQRHEAVLGYRPALVRFGRRVLQTRALQVFRGARGAGDDGDGTLPRVGLAFLSLVAALADSAARVTTAAEGMRLHRAGFVVLPVLCGRGDLAGVRTVFGESVFALVVAVLVAIAEICKT